ncbi:glycoside hydrolase family 3 C-terminal domain-containing protein [Actinomadura graeca]|uniref:beta-N-acetylhexosaminidase n=1 Tax=Actinomadura graeca TaxID=2750812 RepID=A0ABX8QVG7_9ACTN|nr:glycoside hydrolase family 3 protein [Actinomadura graeca]QXJ21984.1 glycoside hydrolase family 3 C-terminal domain-containing protein [Actinomadura graeca]
MRVRRPLALAAAAVIAVPLAGCGGGTGKGGPGPSARSGASGPPGAGTSPARPDAWIPGYVGRMSLAEKVGQLFVPRFSSRADGLSIVRRYHVGGLIYFPENMGSPSRAAAQSNALQKASKVPLLLGVDEEQGIVSRTPFLTRFPGNMALGATGRPADARAAARVTGTELRAIGINQDFAPVADVNVNARNPVIGLRSFGSDPAKVSAMLAEAIGGYQDAGVAATAKHFPGHGDTATDSHTGLPVITHSRATWERLDAPPFKAAIAAGVDAVMTAHIVVPKLDRSGDPSTLSRTVLTGLLRGTLGYRGVIVTDSLEMAGARRRYGDAAVPVRAVGAGADQLLMPPDLPRAYNAVLKAVRSGRIPERRLDESVTRIIDLKRRRGLFAGTRADPATAASKIGTPAHRAVARRVAEHAITLVRDDRKVLPLKGRTVAVAGPDAAGLGAALRRRGVRTAAPGAADVTVLTTIDAGRATAVRVRALGPKPVVVAALGRPYDLDAAGGAAAALAAYSSGRASIDALAGVLAGAVEPVGRLPVPAAGKRAGHGLGR